MLTVVKIDPRCTIPDGSNVYPVGPAGYESRWRFGQQTYEDYLQKKLIVWKQVNRDGAKVWQPYVKYYLEGRLKRPSPLWDDIDGNKKATIEVKELLGDKVFDNPKPTELVKRLLKISFGDQKEGYALDFFAGSGTTAHAVLDMNQQDGGNRRFILVQLPEPCGEESSAFKAGFKTIADITNERVRRLSRSLIRQILVS